MLASPDIASYCGLAETSVLKLATFVGVTDAGNGMDRRLFCCFENAE